MTITVTDLFCGAGGSSWGLERIAGVEVKIAANHWQLAIYSHHHNHPHTDHHCADIARVNPRFYPATDLLWASPECTNHSVARGKRKQDKQPDLFGEILPDEAAEKSRATMMDVPRFLEAGWLRGKPYAGFLVENVCEVRDWMFYDSWLRMLANAGYCVHIIDMNSMFASAGGVTPAAQSRNRWYAMGHRTLTRCPDIRKWTHPRALCTNCGETNVAMKAWKKPNAQHGKYGAQYVWACPDTRCKGRRVYPAVLPAASVIDWALPGQQIGDRDRPLAARTMARIEAGIAKYARPLLVPAGGTWNDSATPLDAPMRTRTTRETEGIACPPILWPGNATSASTEPGTATCDKASIATQCQSMITWPDLLLEYQGKGGTKPATQPMGTLTTVDRFALLSGGATFSLDAADWYFRMLEPAENKRGMAFPFEYVLLGNRREQIRQAGNAVTPPVATVLGAALIEAITGQTPHVR